MPAKAGKRDLRTVMNTEVPRLSQLESTVSAGRGNKPIGGHVSTAIRRIRCDQKKRRAIFAIDRLSRSALLISTARDRVLSSRHCLAATPSDRCHHRQCRYRSRRYRRLTRWTQTNRQSRCRMSRYRRRRWEAAAMTRRTLPAYIRHHAPPVPDWKGSPDRRRPDSR